MTLTGKLALLASMSFIFAMSWLVSQVARPIVEMHTPLIARGQDSRGAAEAFVGSNATRRPVEAPIAGEVKSQFHFASTLAEANQPSRPKPDENALVMAEDVSALESELPAMYVPEAPIVARADFPIERAWNKPAPAASEDEAVFASALGEPDEKASPARTPVLMALLPEETTGVGMGWEMSAEQPAPQPTVYVVQQGDSLQKIMKRLWNRTDREALDKLLAANPDLAKRQHRIMTGERLIIPDPNAPATPVAAAKPVPASKKQGEAAPAVAAAKPAPASKKQGEAATSTKAKTSGYGWYTVQKKDSLVGIAKRHLKDSNRWREIAEMNGMHKDDRLVPGSKIKVPSARIDT
jgi:nucleoid-associated protein YgaU